MKRLLFLFILASSHAHAAPESTSVKRIAAKPSKVALWNQGALGREASLLFSEWQKEGHAQRFKPRMLEQAAEFPVIVTSQLLSPDTEGCTTIAVLGTPNISFILAFDENGQAPTRRAWPVPSAAGVAEVTRCGARKPLLAGLSVKMRSLRGVLEFVVLHSSHPPKPMTDILPHRNAGPSLEGPQVGKRPGLAPLKARLELRKAGYQSNGALQVLTSGATADKSGRGSFVVHLDEGCHRLDLLGEASIDLSPDLDARLTTLAQDVQLESDEEHSGQASLIHCVGRGERFRVEFSGAQRENEITLLHAHWELPDGIPIGWGPRARAELARSIFNNGFPPLDDLPSLSALGVRGTTRLQAEVDPESCYVVAIAPLRGESQRFALGVELPGSPRESQTTQAGHGAALQFCSRGENHVDLETQTVGNGLAWILGLWQLGTGSTAGNDFDRLRDAHP